MAISIAAENQSQLAIIDVQAKLCKVMPENDMATMLANISRLMQAANQLNVPLLVTEQYPEALGESVEEVSTHLAGTQAIAKTAFSAVTVPKFKSLLQRDKSQIMLVGLEAHICVLQTALDLLAQGKQVFIPQDAVISRNPDNKANALSRLANAGCIITNTESILFEWLGDAQHPAFKAISKLIK